MTEKKPNQGEQIANDWFDRTTQKDVALIQEKHEAMTEKAVEKAVEEFDVFLDKYTGKHDDNWLKQSLYADTVQVRKDIILKEFRTTITSLLATQQRENVERLESIKQIYEDQCIDEIGFVVVGDKVWTAIDEALATLSNEGKE